MVINGIKKGDLVRRKDKKSSGKLIDYGKIESMEKKYNLVISKTIREELGDEVAVIQREIGYLIVRLEDFREGWEKGKITWKI